MVGIHMAVTLLAAASHASSYLGTPQMLGVFAAKGLRRPDACIFRPFLSCIFSFFSPLLRSALRAHCDARHTDTGNETYDWMLRIDEAIDTIPPYPEDK